MIHLAVLGLSWDTQELQSLLWHVGSSSLTRARTQVTCIGSDESQPLKAQPPSFLIRGDPDRTFRPYLSRVHQSTDKNPVSILTNNSII